MEEAFIFYFYENNQDIPVTIKNPKYEDVVKNTTGHYETLEIIFDKSKSFFKNY